MFYLCSSERFPYYSQNDDRWKNSVRHNLSINPHFRKGVKASQGAGHLWNLSDMEPVLSEEDVQATKQSNWISIYSKENNEHSYENRTDLVYIEGDNSALYTNVGNEKLYECEAGIPTERVEIYHPDTMMNRVDIGRKSILEYAAHDIIMEEQQNAALIYSMYDENGVYDTLPLFPDEFTLSCYNNLPPMM
ncbi:hypothetical protein WDU94_012108 [Cyamophila willieti]